jgi:Protein of unknown function (DUF1153)
MAMKRALIDHGVRDQTAQLTVKLGGRRLTLADLPLPDTKRWVIRRKAEVIAAVRGGLLSLDEACSRYALSSDEILSWQDCIDRFGIAGLRTTCTQFHLRRVARPERGDSHTERRLQRQEQYRDRMGRRLHAARGERRRSEDIRLMT